MIASAVDHPIYQLLTVNPAIQPVSCGSVHISQVENCVGFCGTGIDGVTSVNLRIFQDGRIEDGNGNRYEGLKEVHDALATILSRNQSILMTEAVVALRVREAMRVPFDEVPKYIGSEDSVTRIVMMERLETGI